MVYSYSLRSCCRRRGRLIRRVDVFQRWQRCNLPPAPIAPGEHLLFYSDGLVEAHNSRREMFDTPRLKLLLEGHTDGASLIDVLLGELKRFTGDGWEQEDDVTLVTLQRMQIP